MPARGAALKCINGHKLSVSWTVPVGVRRSAAGRAVQAVKTKCPLCGNELDVFIDGRSDARSLRIRTDA
jgi:hypothetical protein